MISRDLKLKIELFIGDKPATEDEVKIFLLEKVKGEIKKAS